MAHYLQGGALSLCKPFDESFEIIENLNHEDIEQIRQLPSFRPYVESLADPTKVIALLEDDDYFLKCLPPLLTNIYKYFSKFHCFLRLLMSLLQYLPKNDIGKQLKDLYSRCTSADIVSTMQFEDCWQLLSLLSKEEFLRTINEAIAKLNQYKEMFCSDDVIGRDTGDVIDEVNSF